MKEARERPEFWLFHDDGGLYRASVIRRIPHMRVELDTDEILIQHTEPDGYHVAGIALDSLPWPDFDYSTPEAHEPHHAKRGRPRKIQTY